MMLPLVCANKISFVGPQEKDFPEDEENELDG